MRAIRDFAVLCLWLDKSFVNTFEKIQEQKKNPSKSQKFLEGNHQPDNKIKGSISKPKK